MTKKELDRPNSNRDKGLREAGLTGKQLDFKLGRFNEAFTRFHERGTLKLLDKVLRWTNSILKSLISALPGAEAIKGFKEALENELADDDPV